MYKLKRDTKDEELDLLWRPITVDSEADDISVLHQQYRYPKFPNNCKSLLSKHCTKDVFKQLQFETSEHDYSFSRAIYSGIKFPGHPVGVFSGG